MGNLDTLFRRFLKRLDSKEGKEPDIEMLKEALIEFTTIDPDQLTPEQLDELLKKASRKKKE